MTEVDVAVGPSITETLSMDGNQGELLRIFGSITIDVFGFVILERDFGFENATGDFYVTDAGAATPTTELLYNVDFLSIGGSVTTAFAGINGGTEDAIGFNVSNAQFALLIVTDAVNDIKYTALKANVTDGSFIGVDGITVGVDSTVINRQSHE